MIGLPYGEKNYDDMLSRFHLIPERHERTDRRTDRIAISISRVSVLTRDKKRWNRFSNFWLKNLWRFFKILNVDLVSGTAAVELSRPTCLRLVFMTDCHFWRLRFVNVRKRDIVQIHFVHTNKKYAADDVLDHADGAAVLGVFAQVRSVYEIEFCCRTVRHPLWIFPSDIFPLIFPPPRQFPSTPRTFPTRLLKRKFENWH